MEGDFININKSLLPFSWVYGLGVGFRNLLFEMGVLKSHSFSVPVISVGNITVGGTGKTPHVEYLIRLLKDHMNVAVLSRGYKRKSHGFVLANKDTKMWEIGDEPYQMLKKFPDITMAVDGNRIRGIQKLIDGEAGKEIDVILLDDAFQHRYVKPGINILLVDYHRLIIYDELLPAGRLREPVKSKDRADIVIITKCPKDMKPMEFRVLTKALKLYPYQHLFFSTHEYDSPKPVFPELASNEPLQSLGILDSMGVLEALDPMSPIVGKNILLLTGIASPEQMEHDLTAISPKSITMLTFGDHHAFKQKDIRCINEAFSALPSPKLIITTEKDATRLETVEGLSDEVKSHLFILPIHMTIIQGQQEEFNQQITKYVQKNSRNSILAKGKNDYKPKNSNRSGDRPRTISFRDN
jgi:tetraacyldisaccharide 4'-kinase